MSSIIEIKNTIEVHEHFLNLANKAEIQLCKKAIEAKEIAYAPYSKFKVGAAVLLDNKAVVTGSNQENAVYPLGLCAERVAVFSANNLHPNNRLVKLALATDSVEQSGEFPIFPCGSCRQVMAEEEYKHGQPIELLVLDSDGKVYRLQSIQDILPFTFRKEVLKP